MQPTDIVINEELKAYIDPLTPDEHEALERSLLAEGCRDALVLWGNVLVDGHNRYGICTRHGIPFQTVQNPRFRSMDDVHLWMIDQHLGRRSVSDFQRGLLALRKREILEARRTAAAPAPAAAVPDAARPVTEDTPPWGEGAGTVPAPPALDSREAVARAARISSAQVQMIEKIQKQAAPEVVAAVRAGALSINAAAAVATLPEAEQKAAAQAGAGELKQVAKRVRDGKRKPKAEAPATAEGPADGAAAPESPQDLATLRARVEELEGENARLREQVATLQKLLAAR